MLKVKTAFDPDDVRVLDRAYTEAVRAAGLPPHPAGDAPGTPQFNIAHRIMRLALQGERDPQRLRDAGYGPARGI